MAGIRISIRLSGVGGQGLVLAGLMLGEAAAVHQGLHAVQTQSYAPLARGGPSRSDVIVGDAPIDFPKIEEADVLVALTARALEAHGEQVAPGGLVVVDESAVDGASGPVLRLPLSREANAAGAPAGGAAVVALAVVARATGCVSDDALRKAVSEHVPTESREANLAALERGFALWEGHGRPRVVGSGSAGAGG